MTTPLGNELRALADAGHPRAVELRAAADELDDVVERAEAPPRELALLGAWARARRILFECDPGRPMIEPAVYDTADRLLELLKKLAPVA